MTVEATQTLACVRELMKWSETEGCFEPDAPLGNFLDSFHVVQLVTLIEDRFHIQFEQEDLADEGAWTSARGIADLWRLLPAGGDESVPRSRGWGSEVSDPDLLRDRSASGLHAPLRVCAREAVRPRLLQRPCGIGERK